jgi:hypothetical protein
LPVDPELEPIELPLLLPLDDEPLPAPELPLLPVPVEPEPVDPVPPVLPLRLPAVPAPLPS